MYNFEEYREYAKTDKEKANLELFIAHGSIQKAAKVTGISRNTLKSTWKRIRDRAALKTFAPECGIVNPVPEIMNLKGMSDMRTNSEGKPVWYKYDVSMEKKLEFMREAFEALKEDLPVYEPIKRNQNPVTNDDLLNCYVISDYHIGLIAFESMTGDEDWDTTKAEELLYKWFDMAIQSSPPASNALFLELGDFMHIDNQTGTTSRSGNVLPHDFPLNKLMKVAIRAYNVVIHKLAQKYKNVKVIVVDGNHNDNGAKWSSGWLSYMYQDNKSVTIDDSEDSYYCHKFGDVSIFAHHGHIKNIGNVQESLISKFRDIFGSTKHSYCHLGHYHHIQSKETNLMVLEQHRTLSAKDNHASQGGYGSGRSACVITYHKKLGEISRATISRDSII